MYIEMHIDVCSKRSVEKQWKEAFQLIMCNSFTHPTWTTCQIVDRLKNILNSKGRIK